MVLIQINKDQLDALNDNDKVLVKCSHCGEDFYVKKNKIIKAEQSGKALFCSSFCKTREIVCNVISIYKESLLCPLQHLFCDDKKKTKIKRQKLCLFIMTELKKRLPDLLITQKDCITTDIVFDIYVPSLKIGFVFKKIYDCDLKIKHDVFNKINTCKQNGIKLYFFDINEFDVFNKKLGVKYTNEIHEKIIKENKINNYKNKLNEKTIN